MISTLKAKDEAMQKWDMRFLRLAREVSAFSKDPSTQVGCVLVDDLQRMIATGYNGFPRGVADDPKLLMTREQKYERVVHAEVNAILQAGHACRGATLYVWPPGGSPTCARCAGVVIQAGIRRCVGVKPLPGDPMAERWAASWAIALDMYEQAGVAVHLYSYREFEKTLEVFGG